MAFDQAFPQLLPQRQSPGVYPAKPVASGSTYPAKLKLNRESNNDDGERFLSTLKRVSQKADQFNRSARIGRDNPNEANAPGLKERMDEDSKTSVAQNEDMSAPDQPSGKKSSEQDDPMPVMPNWMDIS